MSVKKTWHATPKRVAVSHRHRQDENGVFNGVDLTVWLGLEVIDGPSKGRLVGANLSPTDARDLAAKLISKADEVEGYQ